MTPTQTIREIARHKARLMTAALRDGFVTIDDIAEAVAVAVSKHLEGLRALSPPPPSWHPISSAPKDGTHIAVVTKGGDVLKAHYGDLEDFSAWMASEEEQHPHSWDDGVCWAENSSYMPSDPPTHWMNLPPGPKETP